METDVIRWKGRNPIQVEGEWAPEVGLIALYLRFSDQQVAKTIEYDEPDVFIDVDREGRLVGIEMINPARVRFNRVFRAIGRTFKVKDLEGLARPAAALVHA